MQFIISVLVMLVFDGLLLWYLVNSSYFSPQTLSGDVDVWNIAVIITMVSIAAGNIIALAVYVSEKLLYCGKKEFPSIRRAVKFGLVTSLVVGVGLVLHVFHFLNTVLVIVLCALVLIGIIIIR